MTVQHYALLYGTVHCVFCKSLEINAENERLSMHPDLPSFSKLNQISHLLISNHDVGNNALCMLKVRVS